MNRMTEYWAKIVGKPILCQCGLIVTLSRIYVCFKKASIE